MEINECEIRECPKCGNYSLEIDSSQGVHCLTTDCGWIRVGLRNSVEEIKKIVDSDDLSGLKYGGES